MQQSSLRRLLCKERTAAFKDVGYLRQDARASSPPGARSVRLRGFGGARTVASKPLAAKTCHRFSRRCSDAIPCSAAEVLDVTVILDGPDTARSSTGHPCSQLAANALLILLSVNRRPGVLSRSLHGAWRRQQPPAHFGQGVRAAGAAGRDRCACREMVQTLLARPPVQGLLLVVCYGLPALHH